MSILSVASDQDLFKDPPPKEECQICFCLMECSSKLNGIDLRFYLPCCGNMMCDGCYHEIMEGISMGTLKRKCVFCRNLFPISTTEMKVRYKERANDDVRAFTSQFSYTILGYTPVPGEPKTNKELELFKRGAEIGSTDAHFYVAEAYWYEVWNNISDLLSKRLELLRDEDISVPYVAALDILTSWLKMEGLSSSGVSLLTQVVNLVQSSRDIAEYLARTVNLRDIEKAIYHYEIAAMGGNEIARFWLGVYELIMGNMSRSTKHFMIAAKCGHDFSLELVGLGYRTGLLTKDDYACALRAHKRSRDEMDADYNRLVSLRVSREERESRVGD